MKSLVIEAWVRKQNSSLKNKDGNTLEIGAIRSTKLFHLVGKKVRMNIQEIQGESK